MTENSLYMDIFCHVADILADRQAKYGGAYQKTRDEFGPAAFYVKVWDKLYRLEQADQTGEQTSETAIDSIIDIMGYCALELAYRQGR